MSLGVVGVSSPAYLFLDGLQEKEQLVLPIKERGNFNFKDGRYRAAIGDYTRAIRISLVSMETSILYYSLPLHSLLLLLFRSIRSVLVRFHHLTPSLCPQSIQCSPLQQQISLLPQKWRHMVSNYNLRFSSSLSRCPFLPILRFVCWCI